MTQFVLALKAYQKAFQLISNKGFVKYLIVPGIINVLLFAFYLFMFIHYGQTYLNNEILPLVNDLLKNFDSVILSIIRFFILVFYYISLFLFYALIYKYISLIVLSPFHSWLSEKTETEVTQKKYSFSYKQLMHDFIRSLKLNSRNAFLELLITLSLFLLSFVPVLAIFTSISIFIIQAYFAGFSYLDFSMERHQLNLSESKNFVRRNKMFTISCGVIYLLIFLIPFIGWILAPTITVMATTLGFLDIQEKQKIQ